MPHNQPSGAGRFSTAFTLVPASAVHVAGVPHGAAGAWRAAPPWLTSSETIMTISPDTAGALHALPHPKRFIPRRPAPATEVEFMSLVD